MPLMIWIAALPAIAICSLCVSVMLGPIPNVLYDYQTLFAGLLALGSAIVAAVLLQQQTKQGRDLENERKRGQRAAARSWLSLHLSTILNYAERMGKDLWHLVGECQNGKLPHGTNLPDFPALPMDAAVAVKDFSQFATKEEAEFIALLFASMQLLDTNVKGLKQTKASHYQDNIENFLIYAAELYARAEALLGFARLITDEFPKGAKWARLRGGIFHMTLSHEPTDWITAYIAKGSAGDLESYLPNRFEKDES